LIGQHHQKAQKKNEEAQAQETAGEDPASAQIEVVPCLPDTFLPVIFPKKRPPPP
jgi:hypothetical protein